MNKNYATFCSDFADDSEENASGEIVVPPGRSIAMALSRLLPNSTVPSQHSFYGWTFEFESPNGSRARVLLQNPDPWLLTVEAKRAWFQVRSNQNRVDAETLAAVVDALGALGGASNITWMSKEEFETPKNPRE
jgi:hypothetical protein